MGAKGILTTIATRVAWLAIALLIALGTAGITAAMNQPPGSAGRSELTAAGDAAMAPALDAATAELEALAAEVDELGSTARRALTQMTAGDVDRLEETVTDGTLRLGAIADRTTALDTALAGIPYTGDDWALYVSDGLRRRYDQLAGTAGITAGLEEDWATFTGRALAASRLTSLLARHDEETAAAARLGSDGKYREALAQLDASDATIVAARALRDDLAATTDVATLTSWLDRNAEYDAALRALYDALIKSDAKVNDAVRRAFDREQAARAQLPGDTRALVVIMSDIAQGGLNQALIAIEETRGALAEALEAQVELRDGDEAQPALPE